MRAFFILILISLITCCASYAGYEQTVANWRGADTKTLINKWGKPYFTDLTDSNHKLYVYSVQSFASYPPDYHYVPAITVSAGRPILVNVRKASGPERKVNCYISFVANNQNIITSTTIHGNNCTPVPSPP